MPTSVKAAGLSGTNGQVAVARAQSMLGGRYVWDADKPKTRTFDCSGLAMYCYAPFKKLTHSAAVQFTQLHHRPYSEAQPGDLVFFGHTAASIFHVGIYVGGGQMISALDPAEGIRRTAVPTTARIPLVGVCPGGATAAAGGQSVAQAMLSYLRNNPLTRSLNDAADAAIIGNADIESGDNPAAHNASEGADGLFQEEGSRGAQGGLGRYAAAHHESVHSFAAQMGYMTEELAGSKSFVLDELRRVPNTIAGATAAGHYWQRDFEGSSTATLAAREAHSRARFQQIQSDQPLTGGPGATAVETSAVTSIANPLGSGGALAALNPQEWVDAAAGLGTRMVAWAGNALIVVVGIVLVVLALYLAAKSTGQDVSLNDNGRDTDKPGGDKTHHAVPVAGAGAPEADAVKAAGALA